LFKPFSRTDSAETFDTEGLGFSLYLDKVITNYLKGNIAVESDQGTGTRVTVSVPVAL
jgi:signal transduction histidine kinase